LQLNCKEASAISQRRVQQHLRAFQQS